MSAREACSAGAKPNRMPVRNETPIVKPNTPQSGRAESTSGVVPVGMKLIGALFMPIASTSHSAPPVSDSIRLSTNNCRVSQYRLAPRATRIAISLLREAARAISRIFRPTTPASPA
jgi:hypothetical protein